MAGCYISVSQYMGMDVRHLLLCATTDCCFHHTFYQGDRFYIFFSQLITQLFVRFVAFSWTASYSFQPVTRSGWKSWVLSSFKVYSELNVNMTTKTLLIYRMNKNESDLFVYLFLILFEKDSLSRIHCQYCLDVPMYLPMYLLPRQLTNCLCVTYLLPFPLSLMRETKTFCLYHLW